MFNVISVDIKAFSVGSDKVMGLLGDGSVSIYPSVYHFGSNINKRFRHFAS